MKFKITHKTFKVISTIFLALLLTTALAAFGLMFYNIFTHGIG